MTGLSDMAGFVYRRVIAAAYGWSGVTRRTLHENAGRVAVLMYHRVLPDSADANGIEPGMFVRASTFARHLRWLHRNFEPTTMVRALETHGSSARPEVALTFDDGWFDNLSVAWPILRDHGMTATIFLVAEWIASTGPDRGFLDPAQVRELSREGMEFGAHTVTHPRLPSLGDAEIERELRDSREAVQDWTGRPCEIFAYPYGAHDDRVVSAARKSFRAAVVVGGGWWNGGTEPHRIPRVAIHEDVTATRSLFEARVAGLR